MMYTFHLFQISTIIKEQHRDCPTSHRIWQGVGRLLQLCQGQGSIKWGNICWLSWQATIGRYEHQEERMTLVIKAQEVFFSSSNNVHSTPLNDKSQEVLELVSPITHWILWKQRCRRVFSNQTAHPTRLLQEIQSEIVAPLKSQYDGLKGGSEGVERQQIAFIQQWSSSPFLESVGIHIRWNYRVPTGICT